MFSLNLLCDRREFITSIIYFTLLLDNVLLTVIVPILPDFLINQQSKLQNTTSKLIDFNQTELIDSNLILKQFETSNEGSGKLTKHPHGGTIVLYKNNNNSKLVKKLRRPTSHLKFIKFEDENGSIGILLSVKAFVQLVFNPIVGILTKRFGYKIPLFFGTICIFISSLVFGVGERYNFLFFARGLQGVGSACISVCGMSLVAHLYPEEDKRSKIMGIVLGSIALGVLIGYPFGGIVYDIFNKSSPFYVIGFLLSILIVIQFLFLDMKNSRKMESPEQNNITQTNWWSLLTDQLICLIACAIWISTSAMAILEPCLPIWLLSHLHPKKWQLGAVFIPDSIGYLIGTNFFGSIAYKLGQIKIAILALLLVGISCIIIPSAGTVLQLLLPHFGLGLGIGVLDAALVPLLAALVDTKFITDDETSCDYQYGAIYAIQQTAVSLAYSFAPMIGGELAQSVGFPWLMRIIGLINLTYCPIFLYFTSRINLQPNYDKDSNILLNGISIKPTNYKKFYNSID